MKMVVRSAQASDMKNISLFLRQAGLAVAGTENMSENFLFLEAETGNIEGTLGMETLGKYGLLRSFAVSRKVTKQNLLTLFEEALIEGRKKGLEKVFLAVNKRTSVELFTTLGFSVQEKSSLPPQLLQSNHAKQIHSVDNSIFMMLNLN